MLKTRKMPSFSTTRLRRWRSGIIRFLIGFVVVILALRLWPHESLRDHVPVSTGIWSADGELLRVTQASDGQFRLWTRLSNISPDLTEAFLLKEDRWFYWHPGVNPLALIRAAMRTLRGDGRQGGSNRSPCSWLDCSIT
jgi:penicillin-binding protein 1C